jgi:hypothetical protein
MISFYRTRNWDEAIFEQREYGQAHKHYARSTVIEYQPGNGTRYAIVFTRVCDSPRYLGGPCWVISWPESSKSMYLRDGTGELLHWRYVVEKMNICKGDAVPIAELIARVTGRTAISSEEVTRTDQEVDAYRAANND